jgi:hypothetical protein
MISVMRRQIFRGLFPLGIIFAVICVLPARAQSPPCVDKMKLPYPTFAQEIRSENGEQPVARAVLGDLRIEGDVHDRDAVQKRILNDFATKEFESENELVDYVNELGIRGDFQQHGYYEIEVSSEAQPLDTRDQKQPYLVVAHVKEGEQFRLGELSLLNADPERALIFPIDKLRPLVHLQTGDVFDVDEIRKGIENLTRFYGSMGYMDFTAEPDFDIDHIHNTISVVLRLSELYQYRVESITITGLTPKLEKALRAKVKVNGVYNYVAIDGFYEENKEALSRYENPRNSYRVYRNIAKSTVTLNFSFITCSLPFN